MKLTIVRQAFLPLPHEGWPAGERLRWIYLGRLWMLPLTMLGNLGLWLNLRSDPQARRWVADLFIIGNNGLLLSSLIATLVFLRRPGRGYAAAMIYGAVVEQLTAVIWIQMTGTVTSYFLGTLGVLAFLYRVLAGYWAGLAAFGTGVGGLIVAYALEEAGVLPRSSIFAADVGSNLLPELYRQTAFISILGASMIAFVGTNLLSRALERGRVELADARAELAVVVDEAKLGRLSGRRIGRYQIGELLGRGGMGEVYDARGDGPAPIAIKILHQHLGAESTARARFRREGDLVRRLPAAVAPAVLEMGTTDDGTDFIVMERLEGEDLGGGLRRRGRLSPLETAMVITAIARGVEQAHDAGVIHRDLKPSNVFLIGGALDDVRILDFGIARLYEAASPATLTESSAILGSPGYMPPEQALGERERVGPTADVYALGAIAYRALTGQAAFPSRSAAAAIQEAIHHIPPPPSSLVAELGPAVDATLARALAKDPLARHPRVSELAAELGRALGADVTLSDASAAGRT